MGAGSVVYGCCVVVPRVLVQVQVVRAQAGRQLVGASCLSSWHRKGSVAAAGASCCVARWLGWVAGRRRGRSALPAGRTRRQRGREPRARGVAARALCAAGWGLGLGACRLGRLARFPLAWRRYWQVAGSGLLCATGVH